MFIKISRMTEVMCKMVAEIIIVHTFIHVYLSIV